jgi:hypothetical protein
MSIEKINKKEMQNIQRVYIKSLEERLNEAVSPAGGGHRYYSDICYKGYPFFGRIS